MRRGADARKLAEDKARTSMREAARPSGMRPHRELFADDADVGVRGFGPTRTVAFGAAPALTSGIDGSVGTAPAIMVGPTLRPEHAFASFCHGAGRRLSRHQALRQWHRRAVVDGLQGSGISLKSPSMRGVAEEAAGACKDVTAIAEAAHRAGLSRKVVALEPLVCTKGRPRLDDRQET
jgi:hypothetical protein